MASGSLGILLSMITLPHSSMTQTAVARRETTNPGIVFHFGATPFFLFPPRETGRRGIWFKSYCPKGVPYGGKAGWVGLRRQGGEAPF